ncbi:hypothetical protein Tco_0269214 [Tanacetum coccineum]
MILGSFQAPVGGVAINEPASRITQKLLVIEGKGKGIATDEQVAQLLLDLQKLKKQSTTDQYIFQRRILVTQDASTGPYVQPQDDTSANVVRDTPSPADAKTSVDTKKSTSKGDTKIFNDDEEHGEEVSHIVALEERTVELDEGHVGSGPGKTPESRPPPERVLVEEDQAGSNLGQSHVVQAGPNLEPMHEDFLATVYPQVHESLKLTTKEHVHIKNPPSSSGTLSSMKNLNDAFTFGDQFLNGKPTKEDPAPPLSTPIIDLTPPKPVSPPAQEPVFTATTATTTTLPLPPPPPQQSTTDHALATRVSALEKICVNFKKKHKLQDKTTQDLSSRVFTLENYDPYSKIDNYVNETVKEAVHNALQAPIREHFRELSHLEHTALYDAHEVSMDRENREEFIEATAKSHKRRRDKQDPPPLQKSSAWKTSDTKEAPFSSSKKKYVSPSEQLIDDIPIQDDVHLSDSEDTGAAHLPKIKTRPDWLKLLSEEEAPKTPEPDWVIPPNDLPETENNWADALAKTYIDPKENKLLQKTRDMGSFIN